MAKAVRARKLSDKQFVAILRKNAGIYARTARAIEKEFGIDYSRQAVRIRAERFPDVMADILEESVDIAEEGLHDLMRSSLPNIRLKAIELFLKSKGSHRGYHQKDSVNHTGEVSVNVTFVDESDKP
jgi:hypothetical protein